jgi:hypothetical protein
MANYTHKGLKMKTELELCASARGQYRAAFMQMARGGSYDLFFTPNGVTLDRAFEFPHVAVRDVNRMTEETMVLKLSAMVRSLSK